MSSYTTYSFKLKVRPVRAYVRAWKGAPWKAGSRCIGLVVADPDKPAWKDSASPAMVMDWLGPYPPTLPSGIRFRPMTKVVVEPGRFEGSSKRFINVWTKSFPPMPLAAPRPQGSR